MIEYEMPIISPVKIQTKGLPYYKRLSNWIFKTRKWRVEKDYYIKHPLKDRVFIKIPKKFVFNGASIPKCFWIIYNPVGILFIASLPHDYGYEYHSLIEVGGGDEARIQYTQKEIDIIFRKINEDINQLKIASGAAYYTLRLMGWYAWNKSS